MVIGGLLSFKWPSVGGIIVCVAAMIGLIYTYDRGQYRWTPYLYYWWGPWLFAWICGIFAGYAAYQQRAAERREARPTRATRRATKSEARLTRSVDRAPGPPAGGPGALVGARGPDARRGSVRPPAGSSPARR